MHHRPPPDLSEIVIGGSRTQSAFGEPAAHAASATHDDSVEKQQTFCCDVALVLSSALNVRSVRSVRALLMSTFNAHPNSLTLCSRRRQFSSVETRRLLPPPISLSPPKPERHLVAWSPV